MNQPTLRSETACLALPNGLFQSAKQPVREAENVFLACSDAACKQCLPCFPSCRYAPMGICFFGHVAVWRCFDAFDYEKFDRISLVPHYVKSSVFNRLVINQFVTMPSNILCHLCIRIFCCRSLIHVPFVQSFCRPFFICK